VCYVLCGWVLHGDVWLVVSAERKGEQSRQSLEKKSDPREGRPQATRTRLGMQEYEDSAALLLSAADLAGIKRGAEEAGLDALEVPTQRKLPVKAYTCTVVGCGRAFTREQHLSSHVRTHTGALPWLIVSVVLLSYCRLAPAY
jgi:hypothetical protein